MIALVLALALGGPASSLPDYLPSGPAASFLEVTRHGKPRRRLVVLTEAVAVAETGPRQTVSTFGETYAFSPAFLAVERGQPTQIEFWNLQPDDAHDVLLVAPDQSVLMHLKLPPLTKTVFTYTFKKPGLYAYLCTMHAPEMAGQILVLEK